MGLAGISVILILGEWCSIFQIWRWTCIRRKCLMDPHTCFLFRQQVKEHNCFFGFLCFGNSKENGLLRPPYFDYPEHLFSCLFFSLFWPERIFFLSLSRFKKLKAVKSGTKTTLRRTLFLFFFLSLTNEAGKSKRPWEQKSSFWGK